MFFSSIVVPLFLFAASSSGHQLRHPSVKDPEASHGVKRSRCQPSISEHLPCSQPSSIPGRFHGDHLGSQRRRCTTATQNLQIWSQNFRPEDGRPLQMGSFVLFVALMSRQCYQNVGIRRIIVSCLVAVYGCLKLLVFCTGLKMVQPPRFPLRLVEALVLQVVQR